MEIHYGNGGWVEVLNGSDLPGRLYVRFQLVDDVMRIVEVYVDGRGQALPASALRTTKLGVIEQVGQDDALAARVDTIGPDLSRLASYFNHYEPRGSSWVAASMAAQSPRRRVKQAPYREQAERITEDEPPQLGQPPDGRLTDAFLTQVGEVYEWFIRHHVPPATGIAQLLGEDLKSGQKRAQSWIYKARQRGLVPPAARTGRIV